jgi:hypothetical protein
MNMVNNAFAQGNVLGALTHVQPWEWTANDIHQATGNLGMGDGSVQQTALLDLQGALSDTASSGPAKYPAYNMP